MLLAVAVVVGGDGDCRNTAVVLFLPQSWRFCEDATVGRVHDLMDGRWVPVVVVVLEYFMRDVYIPAIPASGVQYGLWVGGRMPTRTRTRAIPNCTNYLSDLSYHTNMK